MRREFLVALFFLTIISLDFVIGLAIKQRLSEIKVGNLGIVNNTLKDSSSLLILGSSRALHHYDSRVIEEDLMLSCFNAGMGGQGLLYNYAILSERMLRNRPEMVVLDISPNILLDSYALEKLRAFIPLADRSKFFNEIVHENPEINAATLKLNLLKYNSILYDFFLNYFVNDLPDKGFVPLSDTLEADAYRPFFSTNSTVNRINRHYLSRIVDLCEVNGVLIVLVISPSYDDFDSNGCVKKFLRDFSQSRSLTLFDYSADSNFVHKPFYFKDQLHLNSNGAVFFSSDLSQKLALLPNVCKRLLAR